MRMAFTTAVYLVAYTLMTFASDWSAIIKPLHKQVPRLEIMKGDDSGICSGVVLNAKAGFLLTAAHCVDGKPEDLSITVNGNHAEVARVNRLLDLAVLRFEADNEQDMALAEKTPEEGTEIAVAGFLHGQEKIHFQFGHIAARRDDDGALVLDSTIRPGDSGGAIINAQGQLVGMSNRYYQGSAVGLAVPVERIRLFVNPYLPKVKP